MKKLFFLILGLGLFASTSNAQYILDDFRGVKWGTHKDSCVREGKRLMMKPTQELGQKNTYTTSGDDLNLGSVKLKNIYYIFTEEDRFERLVMTANGKTDFRDMKYILNYKFGDPVLKDLADGIQYSWNVDGVRVYLTRSESTEDFVVDIRSDYEINSDKKKNRNVRDF
jgi:hypothetical protein